MLRIRVYLRIHLKKKVKKIHRCYFLVNCFMTVVSFEPEHADEKERFLVKRSMLNIHFGAVSWVETVLSACPC